MEKTLLSNIDIFNAITGILFAELYKSFPVPLELNYNTFAFELVGNKDEDLAWQWDTFVEASVKWLTDSEYIWIDSPEAFGDMPTARLAPKGLEIMKSTPDSLKSGETFGSKILQFAKGQSLDALKTIVSTMLTNGMKLILP